MFENPEIPLDSVPSIEAIAWRPLAPAYVWQIIAGQALLVGIVVAVIIGSAVMGEEGSGPAVAASALVYACLHLAATGILAPLSLKRRGYALREHDILYHSGILRRRLTAVPFNRIQHVETTSGPFERLLGLATTIIYTAGGAGGDLKIRGLESDRADRLRTYILQRAVGTDESA